ncbi:hypothetical protein M011DRAFT_431746 [Sporormia fimetaria CBS 119925]|uniref:F-box domain-containing protein n=1 Tax=Sporormia fimetaria CBS 119925 TaxID=1340428 RepID=A0A6A6V1L1_9PLEO|nr:hypothetical protein M011DRAFT_431746 [Sporormia fimetaria CBS 119925]
MMKDVSCCCNMAKIHHFYMSMMALRRNPVRKCKKEELRDPMDVPECGVVEAIIERPEPTPPSLNYSQYPPSRRRATETTNFDSSGPFRFLDLPREVRDQVYSYLLTRPGKKISILDSRAILRSQKKRATAARTRDRLNQKRLQNGRRPITPRDSTFAPIIDVNVIQTSRQLHNEATTFLYRHNWFAISLDSFPVLTIDTPTGWKSSLITRLQLELLLKDAQRMSTYVDWATFFASFPELRFLRLIPTYHPRYYDWTHTELGSWASAHYVFRSFFRDLLMQIPEGVILKLGPSYDPEDNMQLEGKSHVSRRVLMDMHVELGMRGNGYGTLLGVEKVVDRDVVVGV